MNIIQGASSKPALSESSDFEEVNVPAIQAEIQERKLESLPPENLFSREVAGQFQNVNVIDIAISEAHIPTPNKQLPQVVETKPGRPRATT